MAETESLLADLTGELDKHRGIQATLIEQAQADGRDLKPDELELYERSSDRMAVVNGMVRKIGDSLKIDADSRANVATVHEALAVARNPQLAAGPVEYRTAGDFVMDYWRAGIGDEHARNRMGLYLRAAAHQTTADNAGLIPAPILGPVVSFIDQNRTLVSRLGPRQLPGQTWSRPKVTHHTNVALQSAEKAELVSQKMTITKLTGTAGTYGGYVNVSRQDADFTQPGIMDIIIGDLGALYAKVTEAAACTAFD